MSIGNKILPFTELCRPQRFEDIVMTPRNRQILRAMVDGRKPLMNMIFYGDPGCGKTTTARLFSSQPRFAQRKMSINASKDLRDVKNLKSITAFLDRGRGTLANFVEDGTSPYRLVVLEEADHLSPTMLASLRGYIEDNYEYGRFILTMNETKRITPALQSRFLMLDFDLGLMDSTPEFGDRYINRIKDVLKATGLALDDKTLETICFHHFPDFREIEKLIEAYSMPIESVPEAQEVS